MNKRLGLTRVPSLPHFGIGNYPEWRDKMSKTHATLIHWGEIDGETEATHLNGDEEIMLTRTNDDTLIQELRELNEDEHDEFGEYGWKFVGIAHLPKTTIVEWKSDRGHHATTQICWMS